MKHLARALVLAVLLPTTGCFWGGECSRSVQVSWPRFLFADNTTSPSCGAAVVSSVDVWVNDEYAATFACSDGAGDVAIRNGSNVVTVEARDAGGVIRYRDELSVDASSCGFQGTVQAEPAEGRVDVAYAFSPINACYGAASSWMWIYVRDDIANEAAADSSAAPEHDACVEPNGSFSFRLAAGDYSLLRTQEMIRGALAGTYQTVARDCNAYPFRVAGAATTTLTPTLADASVSCP